MSHYSQKYVLQIEMFAVQLLEFWLCIIYAQIYHDVMVGDFLAVRAACSVELFRISSDKLQESDWLRRRRNQPALVINKAKRRARRARLPNAATRRRQKRKFNYSARHYLFAATFSTNSRLFTATFHRSNQIRIKTFIL